MLMIAVRGAQLPEGRVSRISQRAADPHVLHRSLGLQGGGQQELFRLVCWQRGNISDISIQSLLFFAYSFESGRFT
jgi:hypothetical protein